ncbi:MAG: hypothetical protein FD123_2374 [Bacteroidetes bacterium]|nr:MAG: hypothetical protein FD123_2374 [Bacteroidota bacterium]
MKFNANISSAEFSRQLLLIAFASEVEIIQFLGQQGSDEEVANIGKLLATWDSLQDRVKRILQEEENLPETILSREIPVQYNSMVEKYLNDNSIRKTFPDGVECAMVEIDKIISLQRTMDEDYTNLLQERWAGNLGFENILEICLSAKNDKSELKHLVYSPDHHVFSSPNSDLRYLGSYFKKIEDNDLEYSGGGVPVAAIISFVGYGVQPVSVYKVGKRFILNNGFHRVYALRSLGIKEIPVLVKKVHNSKINFPNNFLGFPKEYILDSPRPTLMKDFFEPGFVVPIHCKKRVKIIEVRSNGNSLEVPL